MDEPADANAAIWQSAEGVQAWAAEAERQERSRKAHRRFMALLLPFGEQQAFTFLDLGAGTGAVRYMIPLGRQLGYLRSAGFEGIDVYWKQLGNVIYGGRRPLQTT